MNPASRIFSFSALISVALFAFVQLVYGQAVGANARLSGEVVDGMGGVRALGARSRISTPERCGRPSRTMWGTSRHSLRDWVVGL